MSERVGNGVGLNTSSFTEGRNVEGEPRRRHFRRGNHEFEFIAKRSQGWESFLSQIEVGGQRHGLYDWSKHMVFTRCEEKRRTRSARTRNALRRTLNMAIQDIGKCRFNFFPRPEPLLGNTTEGNTPTLRNLKSSRWYETLHAPRKTSMCSPCPHVR